LREDHDRARRLGREPAIHPLPAEYAADLVRLAHDTQADLIVLPGSLYVGDDRGFSAQARHVLGEAHCPVFLATPPAIPEEAAQD
jgi:nucleotide-binding universal stress UspA family protein